MKRILYILTVILAAACTDMKNSNPYEESLNVLTVTALYPEGYQGFDLEGSLAVVEEMNTGNRYSVPTDAAGCFSLSLPNGIYSINVSGRFDKEVFNGAADKVVVSGSDVTLNLPLSYSRAGSIVIKEIYCGG